MMTVDNHRRRLLGNLLTVVGLLLVLVAAASYGWSQYQGTLLRARLSELPPERPVSIAAASPLPTITPSPESTATATPSATEAGAAQAGASPSGTPTPAAIVNAGSKTAQATSPAATATATASTTAPATATSTPTSLPTPMPPSPPVRIVIPDLGIDVPVTEMHWTVVQTASGATSEWQIPENAGGHAANSADLGEAGNVVISGHNNIYGRVFMAISEAWGGKTEKVDSVTQRSHLLDGRTVELYAADGRRFDYVITDFLRVQDSGVPLAQRIANAQYIAPGGNTRLTLTTCWPPWSNTHRLIVIARPVTGPGTEPVPGAAAKTGQ